MALTGQIGCPEFTRGHDLRHLFSSRAQAAGMNPILVQEVLGHTTLEMTRRYTHFAMDVKRARVKKKEAPRWDVFSHGGRKATGLDAIEWAVKMVDKGAGELLITSIDKDGTKEGYDLELLAAITKAVPLPVIDSGGVGSLVHLYQGFTAGGADAVLAASILH